MIDVRAIEPTDRTEWAVLFRAYREFYELTPDEGVVDRVWSWIVDAEHETAALVATSGGKLVGIAHHRRFARPSTGTTGLYLDDLFVDPDVRGEGVGRRLLDALARIAGSEGLSVVRWITADTNTSAHRLYDSAAQKTRMITYDMQPQHATGSTPTRA